MDPSQLSSVFTFDSATYATPIDLDTERVRVVWGTDINMTEVSDSFRCYLRSDINRIRNMIDVGCNKYVLDCSLITESAMLYNQIRQYPSDMIPILESCLNDIVSELSPGYSRVSISICNIGSMIDISSISVDDIETVVQMTGVVVRTGPVIPDVFKPIYCCVLCTYNSSTMLMLCPQCNSRQSFLLDSTLSEYNDKQWIRFTNYIYDNSTNSINVLLYDTDTMIPGDIVHITGILKGQYNKLNKKSGNTIISTTFDYYIETLHYNIMKHKIISTDIISNTTDNNSLDNINNCSLDMLCSFLQSNYKLVHLLVAPDIFGHYDIKQSILLMLLGGVRKTLNSMVLRGSINVLLTGDPGTAKSRFLQYVHSMTRGYYCSGGGASSVGLTASVIKEDQSYMLSPGALVLSDGGVCCIDEFDKMSVDVRSVLHESMEQQTVSISKAGIITTLNSRCSILAGCNPVDSKYNNKKSIVENINIIPSLLSRFDIISIIIDKKDKDIDRELGEHILKNITNNSTIDSIDNNTTNTSDNTNSTNNNIIDNLSYDNKMKVLREYIERAKQIIPCMTDKAADLLQKNYCDMRQIDGGKTLTATTRQLESLIRLSEAHARLRMSVLLEEVDVLESVRLIKESMLLYAVDPMTGKIDMDLINTGKSAMQKRVMEDLKTEISRIVIQNKRINIKDIILNAEERIIKEAVEMMENEGSIYYDKNTGIIEHIP